MPGPLPPICISEEPIGPNYFTGSEFTFLSFSHCRLRKHSGLEKLKTAWNTQSYSRLLNLKDIKWGVFLIYMRKQTFDKICRRWWRIQEESSECYGMKKKKEELKKASFPFPGDTHAGSRTMNDCRETTAWDSAPLYLNLFLGHRGRLREAHTLDLWASFCHKIKIKSHRRNARKLCQSLSAYRRQINKQEKASTHKRAAVRFLNIKMDLKKVKEPLIFSSKSNLAWLNQVLLHADDEGLSSSLSINFQDFIISLINLELTTKMRFLKVIADIISVLLSAFDLSLF